MIEVFLIRLSVIIISFLIGSLSKHEGILVESSFALLSLFFGYYVYHIELEHEVSFEAISTFSLFAFLLFVLFLAQSKLFKIPERSPTFLPRHKPELYALTFFFAPVGEELLFRYLLVGGLMYYDVSRTKAVITSAVLFALLHAMPFSKAPRKILYIVIADAFVLGLMTGYLFVHYGLLYAIALHALANLFGGSLALFEITLNRGSGEDMSLEMGLRVNF